MDIEDVAALLPAVIPKETSNETLGFLWKNFAGFFKDPQDDMKFSTGIARFVHQRNMRYICESGYNLMRCVPQMGLNMCTNGGDEEGWLWQAVTSIRAWASTVSATP